MKRASLIAAILAALSVGITACNKGDGLDTSRVEASFATPDTDASAKSDMHQVVSSVKAGDWAGASASLKSLASNAKLTPEQQASLKDLMVQVETRVKDAVTQAADKAGEAMGKAKDATGKALEDAGKALQK